MNCPLCHNERKCLLFQMRTGYDGLGGRTKFFQPVSFSVIWKMTAFAVCICSELIINLNNDSVAFILPGRYNTIKMKR